VTAPSLEVSATSVVPGAAVTLTLIKGRVDSVDWLGLAPTWLVDVGTSAP